MEVHAFAHPRQQKYFFLKKKKEKMRLDENMIWEGTPTRKREAHAENKKLA